MRLQDKGMRIHEVDENAEGERTFGLEGASGYIVVTEAKDASRTLRAETISGTASTSELEGAKELVSIRRDAPGFHSAEQPTVELDPRYPKNRQSMEEVFLELARRYGTVDETAERIGIWRRAIAVLQAYGSADDMVDLLGEMDGTIKLPPVALDHVFVVTLRSDAPAPMLERAVRAALQDIDEVGELGETSFQVYEERVNVAG